MENHNVHAADGTQIKYYHFYDRQTKSFLETRVKIFVRKFYHVLAVANDRAKYGSDQKRRKN